MKKTYCDVCKEAISETSLYGGFVRLVKTYQMDQGTPLAGGVKSMIARENLDLCEDCVSRVVKVFDEIKKEKKDEQVPSK